MNEEQWEAICSRCGQCCFNKIIREDGSIYVTPIPCRFFDIVTRNCKVYHKRFATGEECIKLTPALVRKADWLPDDCAYVRRLKSKKDLSDI